MELKAKLTGIALDYKTGLPRLEFTAVEKVRLDLLEELKDVILSVSVKKWRRKRSLDSNAYLHVLCSKIAEKLNTSITEVKNQLIADYGQYEQIDGGLMPIIMLDSIAWEKLDTLHVRPTTATRTLDDGKLYRVFHVMRGSHTYDSAEMARLIDGTISEAKALGIETATPEELRKMAELWRLKIEKAS